MGKTVEVLEERWGLSKDDPIREKSKDHWGWTGKLDF